MLIKASSSNGYLGLPYSDLFMFAIVDIRTSYSCKGRVRNCDSTIAIYIQFAFSYETNCSLQGIVAMLVSKVKYYSQ